MISRPEMSSAANLEAFSLETISSGFEEGEEEEAEVGNSDDACSVSEGSPS